MGTRPRIFVKFSQRESFRSDSNNRAQQRQISRGHVSKSNIPDFLVAILKEFLVIQGESEKTDALSNSN